MVDLVAVDICLSWCSLQARSQEVADFVAVGVVEGVADAEVAEGLAGRSINSELLVAENEVHLIVEDCRFAIDYWVCSAVGQRHEPTSLQLPQVLRNRALRDAGEVVLSILFFVLDDDDKGRVSVYKGMQVAWMVLLESEEQLGPFDLCAEIGLDELGESFLVVLETHQNLAFEEFGGSRNQVFFFLLELSDLLLESAYCL